MATDKAKFPDQLFDCEKDPLELKNLIEDHNYAKVQNQLREYFNDFTFWIPATGKMEFINGTRRGAGSPAIQF